MTNAGTPNARTKMLAFIDEAGQRSPSPKSSDHFTMAAVVWKEGMNATIGTELAALRQTLGRQQNDVLHFVKLNHHQRLAAAAWVGNAPRRWKVVTVTVCKRKLPPPGPGYTEDHAYLWCFRLLLERLSWLARDNSCDLEYTLAHVVRFKKAQLRAYEATLRTLPDCNVEWPYVPRGGSLSTPRADERLQVADIAASATWQAFEPQSGFTETRYLKVMSPALYRHYGKLTSYGLKVIPKPVAGGTYGWVLSM